jgi:MFS family permease
VTASYLTLARRRPARRLLYALASATLSFGMLSLTVLLTVERSTGSYRAAGYAVAAFALAASATAPLRGRLVDRSGARIWLPALASGYATALVALDVAAHAGAPEWALVLFAGASGFSAPPIFASARALWPHVVEIELVRRGYAMTSLFYDAGQIAGPIVASLTFLVSTWAAAIVCGAFALMGALLSLPARAGAEGAARPNPMPSLRRTPALAGLLAVSIVFGGAQGVVQVAVPAAAARWGHASLAGPLLGAFAAGSVAGALWYGSRSWRTPVLERYLLATLILGVLLAPAAAAGNAAELGLVLFAAGLAFGPATVAIFEALDAIAPGAGAEALTWVTTAEAAGSAAGSALAGVLATKHGTAAAFLLASAAVIVSSGAAIAVRRSRR